MPRKKKKTVWHKKKNKFIPSTHLKPHSPDKPQSPPSSRLREEDKYKSFTQNLGRQIKKAVRQKP